MATNTTNENPPSKLSTAQRQFIDRQRVARFASTDQHAQPHAVPVCYCLLGDSIYFSIDEKPKHPDVRRLKRLRNIEQNPRVALVIDHYEDKDWSQLGWVLLRGEAQILDGGDEHACAQQALRKRYVQYQSMNLDTLPVVAIRIERVSSWGAIS